MNLCFTYEFNSGQEVNIKSGMHTGVANLADLGSSDLMYILIGLSRF